MSMTINGQTIEELGFGLGALDGWLDGLELDWQPIAAQGRSSTVQATQATAKPRTFRVTLVANPALLTDRSTFVDRLAHALAGELEVSFADQPDRMMRVVRERVTTVADVPEQAFVVPTITITIGFFCPSGAKTAVQPSVVGIGTTPTEIPLGTLPSTGVLYLRGALSTEVAVRYRGITGTLLEELLITPDLAADEALAIDFATRQLTYHYATGTSLLDYSPKSGGLWFACDPADGGPSAGAWPTLELSSGDGLFVYRKSFDL